MRQVVIFFFAICTTLTVQAESGTVESISGGPYQVTTNDFGDSKYSVFTIKLIGTTLKSDVSEPPRVSRRLVGFNHATAELSC